MDFDSLVKETKITLACKDLKDDDIEVLAEVLEKSTIVTEMDLMLNQITLSDDVFTNALATNESLKILNLYNNKIGVEGAKRLANAIANNKTLEQLNLEGAEIGDDGVKYLAETLKSNSSLEVLILRGNNIGDDGAASLATSLLFNTSIRVILLGQNRISDAGADKLAEVIEYNSVLDQIMLDSNNVSNILDLKIRNALGKPSRKKSKKEQALPRWLFENMLAYKDEKLTEKDAAIKTLQDENSTLEAKIDCKDQEIALLRQLEDEIILLDQKILKRDDAIATMMKEMANKDEKIASMATEISSLKSSLQKPLELLSELLNRKDEEISSLKAKNKSIAKNTPKRSESYRCLRLVLIGLGIGIACDK
ncbi:hypothetical protein ACHAXA_001353 [Cyclostephanos tholiformis]|uniref:Uncharacterized protein n=1 Tax=Cyclostephanos tholiformis TaxID=382380 RepID=A0ABD3RAN3_9STRA